MPTISQLNVELRLMAENFNNGLRDAQREAKEFEKTIRPTTKLLDDMGAGMTTMGQTLSLSVTAPIVAFGALAVSNFNEAAKATALMENAIRSTGGEAGKSADELRKLATSLQGNSIFDDDQIIGKVLTQLLTFTKVSGEAFDRGSQAALNMSTVLGQDLQSSAIQVGKALNDPVAGVTALQRVGVKLTEDQKDLVKSFMKVNDVAGAQDVILKELEKEFGGAAKAASEVGSGPMQQLWVKINNLTESWGELISKAITPFVDILTKVVDWLDTLDESTKKVVLVVAALAAAIGPLLIVLGTMAIALSSLITAFATIGPAITAVTATLGFLAPALEVVGAVLTGPVGIVIGLGAATAALSVFVMKNETLSKLLDPIWNAVGDAINTTVDFIKKLWTDLWDFIVHAPARAKDAILGSVKGVTDGVTGFFKDMYDKVVGHSYVPDMLDRIQDEFKRLPAVMENPVLKAAMTVEKSFESMFATLTSGAASWVEKLSSILSTAGQVLSGFANSAASRLGGILNDVGGMIGGGSGGSGGGGLGGLLGSLGGAGGALGAAGSFLGPIGTGFSIGSMVGGWIWDLTHETNPVKMPGGYNYDPGYGGYGNVRQYATGSDYVSRTGPAVVHQGEAVLNADDNASIRGLLAAILGTLQQGGDVYLDRDKVGRSLVPTMYKLGRDDGMFVVGAR